MEGCWIVICELVVEINVRWRFHEIQGRPERYNPSKLSETIDKIGHQSSWPIDRIHLNCLGRTRMDPIRISRRNFRFVRLLGRVSSS